MKVHQRSPVADKIGLFRSLFRGRSDVYARRFENRRSGRAGYAPACANEWLDGVCEKPRIRCADCAHQRWLPLTDEVVHWHLAGLDPRQRPFVLGLYPLLGDERCALLVADFDDANWLEDAAACLETCHFLGLDAALERSRSGEGGHVWWFFEEPVPAALARRLGSHILTETMERRPEIGLRSYDRLFPNQDTLPRGGFGNLIALPLQKAARDQGHSVFITPEGVPHADQWAFLASVGRVSTAQVESITRAAESRGRVIGVRVASPDDDEAAPWLAPPSRNRATLPAGPMPERLEIVLADQIYLEKDALPPALRNALVRLAAFQNPEFHRAQAMRLSTHDKPRIIACAEDLPRHIGLPRGCREELADLLERLKIEAVWHDERRTGGEPLGLEFHGELRPDQQKAAEAMAAHDSGVLAATTAFGKTVLAAWLIARRGVNTLVLVHRRQLLEQWLERLSAFLGIPAKEIGRWGGGSHRRGGRLDVALIQSLVRKGEVNDLVGEYGHLVVDECHHLSAHSFELVARRAKARFVTGLSATVARKDGHHPIIFMQCGPVRHRVDARAQAAERPFTHEVRVRPTGFLPPGEPEADQRLEFQRLCDAVTASESRNRMICDEVVEALADGRSPILLTERTGHLETLEAMLAGRVAELVVLRGGMGRKALRATLDRLASLPADTPRVLVATGRFVGEGFDDPRLDTLFLTMPVSWRGTIAQYVGRLHRLHHGKRVVRVHDYADLDVPMLLRMFERRRAGYEALGYTVLMPASALPGWPPEVGLPIDSGWKQEFAASVRRLTLDGVDPPLARLFLAATTVFPADGGAPQQARSAAEAFLFQRLESLPATRGRFRLNARLPIPFGDRAEMEIDLLCESARLAIEIDGCQHLADPDAWRRDRHKDLLLQEHGYLVLRILAADLARRLDHLLDTLLRLLARRTPSPDGQPNS